MSAFAREHPAIIVGRYVMLAVSDNGIGMDEATRSRIFEPFFTTKKLGREAASGWQRSTASLSRTGDMSGSIANQDVEPTFKIYLPSADHKVGTVPEAHAEELPPRRDGVTILLAEDDVVMRRLTRKMLEAHGYRVLEAEDGTAALDVISSQEGKIDLILTDVVMKGMNGPELVLRMTESHKETKIVYMSGYTGELVANQGLDAGIRLLEKPFTRADLLKTLDAALG